jgi:CoA:oxalate CoA-transferase
MFAAWGIAAALYDRERTGAGRYVEVAMLDSVFAMLLTSLARRLFTERPPGRVGNRHPETYPVDSFPTKDGDIVLVGFSDAVFQRLAKTMDRAHLIDDPRFRTNRDRDAHETELRGEIAGWTQQLTRAEVLERLRMADIPAAPVWTLDDLLNSGHLEARGMLQPGVNAALGDLRLIPQPVQFSDSARIAPMRTPMLGEHTEQVLRSELGLDGERIAALRAAKTI